jgi:hypothetical protein
MRSVDRTGDRTEDSSGSFMDKFHGQTDRVSEIDVRIAPKMGGTPEEESRKIAW